jgi:uncharacterized protein YcsI (UPF0317 family)
VNLRPLTQNLKKKYIYIYILIEIILLVFLIRYAFSLQMKYDGYTPPHDIRYECRLGNFSSHTAGLANGYAQANICIVQKSLAFDFLLFCQRNPRPCPLLEVLEPGQFSFGDIDIRTDLPKYRVFVDGVLSAEVTDISTYWLDDFVTFVIGCSFSFEEALINSGISLRHIDEGCNVPM